MVDDAIKCAWQKYANMLLTRVNYYTGVEYRSQPPPVSQQHLRSFLSDNQLLEHFTKNACVNGGVLCSAHPKACSCTDLLR